MLKEIFFFISTIIGLSIFALPNMLKNYGLINGIIALIISLITNLITSYLSIKMYKEYKLYLTTLFKKIFKDKAKIPNLITLTIYYIALLAMTVIGSNIINLIIKNWTLSVIIYCSLISAISLMKLKNLSKLISILSAINVSLIITISITILLLKAPVKMKIYSNNLISPLGICLASMMCTLSTPLLGKILQKNWKLKMIIGYLVVLAIYLLFSISIASRYKKLEDLSLLSIDIKEIRTFAFPIILLIISTISISMLYTLVHTINEKVKELKISYLAVIIPLITIAVLFNSFYKIVDVLGSILVPIFQIILIISYYKSHKRISKKLKVAMVFSIAIYIIAFVKNLIYGV